MLGNNFKTVCYFFSHFSLDLIKFYNFAYI